MSNEFKWTDELVLEFLLERLNTGISFDDFKAKQVNKGFADWVPDFLKRAEQPKQVKGWEVQSYKWNGSEFVYYREGNGVPDKFYMRKGGGHEGSAAWLMQQGATIHSVKRLSDGAIFTVGEQQSFGKISSFFYHENELWFSTNSMSGSGLTSGQFTASCLLKPTPKPILITQDGKEIFDSAAKLYSVLPKAQWEQREVRAERAFNYKNWLHFSTRAAAEEYVQEFKPQYSLNDFRKAYNAPIPSPLFDETVEKLIAKSKL